MRFKNFGNYKWNIDKIFNIAPLQRGFDLPEQNIIQGTVPVVYSNGIKNYHNQYKAKGPGIITGRSGTVGKFTYIEDGYYWPHNTSLWVTDFKRNYPKFIYFLFQYVKFENYSTGSGVPTLNRNDIHDKKVGVPKIEEQIKIANFLTKIDERIELQNKIIEDMHSIKNEISNRIFDLKVIEQSTNCLSAYLQEGDKTPVDTSKYKKITIKLNKQGIVYSDINRDMADTRPFYIRHKGELIIGKQNYFNGSIAIVDDQFDNCICSNAIMSFRISGINKDFLYYQISNNNYLNSQSYKANGTGQKELSEKEFLKFKIWCPSMKTQEKIVDCFKSLDNKIENEKAILNSYIQEKNYLLKNMFI